MGNFGKAIIPIPLYMYMYMYVYVYVYVYMNVYTHIHICVHYIHVYKTPDRWINVDRDRDSLNDFK